MSEQDPIQEEPSIEEPPGEPEARGDELPQILHDRARNSSQELHKLLISFSAGLVAVYFFALTTAKDAAKAGPQTVTAIVGLVSMGIAVFAGLLALYADMKRNYFRASAIQAKNDRGWRDKLYKLRNRWRRRQRWSVRALNGFFVLGVASSIAYVIFRILDY